MILAQVAFAIVALATPPLAPHVSFRPTAEEMQRLTDAALRPPLVNQIAAVQLLGNIGGPDLLKVLDWEAPAFACGDHDLMASLCVARAQLARPTPRGSAEDRSYLFEALHGSCPSGSAWFLHRWALEALVDLGDPALWPRIEDELSAPEWGGYSEERKRELLVRMTYSAAGTKGLLSALEDERNWVVRWAFSRIRNERREDALPGLRALADRLESEFLSIELTHRRGAPEWTRFKHRWARAYTEVVYLLRETGDTRLSDGSAPLYLLAE